MSGFFNSSIGKKFVMGVSGIFLVMFLLVHLLLNSFLLLNDGGEMFNAGAHFMATNPIIKVIEPVLAIGFIIHICWGVMLTLQNRKARGNSRYASGNKTKGVSWASKNMFILGLMLLAFLVLHLAHFWMKMKGFDESELLTHQTITIAGVPTVVENAYALVNYQFSQLWIVAVYVVAGICLGLHLSHGVWSGFQTIGLNNRIWLSRFKAVAAVLAFVAGAGFAVIAVAQYLFF
jgi:succinate dehydrogenase / fumarate reductase cytochrome b subunit